MQLKINLPFRHSWLFFDASFVFLQLHISFVQIESLMINKSLLFLQGCPSSVRRNIVKDCYLLFFFFLKKRISNWYEVLCNLYFTWNAYFIWTCRRYKVCAFTDTFSWRTTNCIRMDHAIWIFGTIFPFGNCFCKEIKHIWTKAELLIVSLLLQKFYHIYRQIFYNGNWTKFAMLYYNLSSFCQEYI